MGNNEDEFLFGGFLQCLDAVEEASDWKARYGKLPEKRGLGVAGSAYISGTNYAIYPNKMPQSAVQLKVDRSGRVVVFSGQSEIGQGCDQLLRVIVADELGLDYGAVMVVSGDTDLTPVDLGAYSSRGTFMNGNAALMAAREIKGKLREAVAEHLGCSVKHVLVTRGALTHIDDPTQCVDVTTAIQLAEAKFGTLGAVGHYNTPQLGGDYRGGTIGASPAYSFTAHVAEVEVAEVVETEARPVRRRLPEDCRSVRHKFDIAGHEGYIHVGFYEDGTPGEIFIKMAKEGSTISGLMDTIATLTSLSLQYGAPLEALVNKFEHVRFEPSGFTKNPDIPMAKSLTDYIFRFLGQRFVSAAVAEAAVDRAASDSAAQDGGAVEPEEKVVKPDLKVVDGAKSSVAPTEFIQPQADAPACPDCGSMMIRNGACYKCNDCGATSGCS